MNYITTSKNLPNTRSTRVETTKSEQYLQAQNSKNRNRNNSQPMPKMVNGLSHQAWKLKGRVGVFLLQPRESKWLDFIYHLKNWALLAIK